MLKKRFKKELFILSFANTSLETPLLKLNIFLANNNSLVLPKCNERNLDLYLVKDMNKDIRTGSFKIKEPIPSRCQIINPKQITIA